MNEYRKKGQSLLDTSHSEIVEVAFHGEEVLAKAKAISSKLKRQMETLFGGQENLPNTR